MKKLKIMVMHGLQASCRTLGYELSLARRGGVQNNVIFDRNQLSSYFHPDARRRLHQEALTHGGGGWSDTFERQCRYFSLCQLVERSVRLDPTADAAECGCWKGQSTYMIARLLSAGGFRGRLSVFDSFEGGLSDLSPEDRNERVELTKDEIAAQKRLFVSTEAEVRQALEPFSFVDLYKGWIPERFDAVASRRFSLVHIDVDLYEPIKQSLEFFYPRMIEGGAMVFDDYGLTQFPGGKKAVDEFLANRKPSFFFEDATGGAFLIK